MRAKVNGAPNRISHGLPEAFATPFRRESFSPGGFLRGEKVAKPDEGGLSRRSYDLAISHVRMNLRVQRPLL